MCRFQPHKCWYTETTDTCVSLKTDQILFSTTSKSVFWVFSGKVSEFTTNKYSLLLLNLLNSNLLAAHSWMQHQETRSKQWIKWSQLVTALQHSFNICTALWQINIKSGSFMSLKVKHCFHLKVCQCANSPAKKGWTKRINSIQFIYIHN